MLVCDRVSYSPLLCAGVVLLSMSHSPGEGFRLERHYDWAAVSPSVAVIDAIARVGKTTASRMADRLEPTLGQTIESDALDALLTINTSLALSFNYADYYIDSTSDTAAVSRQNPTPG